MRLEMNKIEYNINLHNNDMELDDIGEVLFKLSKKENVLAKAKYKGYIFTTNDILGVKSVKEAQLKINKLFLNYTLQSLQKMVNYNLKNDNNIIKLKDISANLVLSFNDQNINSLIKEKKADSVEYVLHLIKEYPSYDWQIVKNNIAIVQKRLALANKRGYQPLKIYTHGYDDKKLKAQDKFNYGSILLLDNPTSISPTRFYDLKAKTISQIKKDLAHVNPYGKNYVASALYDYRNIGLENINKLIYALEQYEEQIVRQSRLTSKNEINLFELNKQEKINIAKKKYYEIIMYLMNNTQEELVWNKITNSQKKLYISSAINTHEIDYTIKEKMLNYIANYTTLPEIEKIDNNDLSILKRFIVK